jgi:hypothetical protein
VSPVFTALIDILFAVDMVRMNVLFDGDPTLTVLGPEGREQLTTVDLGRAPTGAWRRFDLRPAAPPRTAGACDFWIRPPETCCAQAPIRVRSGSDHPLAMIEPSRLI